jgi:hypothetical protein
MFGDSAQNGMRRGEQRYVLKYFGSLHFFLKRILYDSHYSVYGLRMGETQQGKSPMYPSQGSRAVQAGRRVAKRRINSSPPEKTEPAKVGRLRLSSRWNRARRRYTMNLGQERNDSRASESTYRFAVELMYSGFTSVNIRGPVSGQIYQFSRLQSVRCVNADDAISILKTGLFRLNR